MSKKVVIVLVDGFEEMEAMAPIDILRRAGLEVTVAGLDSKEVTGAHGVRLIADTLLQSVTELPDAIVLPGGPGAEKLGASQSLRAFIDRMQKADRTIAAICAAPAVVLGQNGFLKGKKATCFPGYESKLGGGIFSSERVVTDGRIVTSRGPGTAVEFALDLAKKLAGEKAGAQIAETILAKV